MDRLTDYMNQTDAIQYLRRLTGRDKLDPSTMWKYRENGIQPHGSRRRVYLASTSGYNNRPMYAVSDLEAWARLLSPVARNKDVAALRHPEGSESSRRSPGAGELAPS